MPPENLPYHIERMRTLPDAITALVTPLTPQQLTTVYLPDEWTVAQNVHHLAEAQMALYFRFKAMVKEDHPTLTPFDQDTWAQTPDSTTADINDALAIIRGVGRRWAIFAASLTDAEWARTGHHPENGTISVAGIFPYAADHAQLHIDQIKKTLAAGGQS